MAYTLTQLQTFFTNANAGTAPTAAQLTGLQSIANQNATGTLSDAQALQSAIDMGSDVTTAVSIQSYQFFLGFAPSVAGLKALNAAYTGSGAQAGLNGENRFIAQAVSLALQNPTAKASFTAAYGSSSVADATAAAYNVIIGNAAAAAAGVNVANAVAFLSSASSVAYYEAFVKANVPGLAAADVSLAVKAAIVGEIIYQATIYNNGAGLGSYATAANNLVKDLADDGALTADNANGIALFDNYGVNPVAQTLTLTTAADTLNGAAGADTFVATNTTLSAADNLTGGAGVDTLNYASNGAVAVNQAGFKAAGIETFNITSDATGGTTFDMSGVTGATRVVNDDSSNDLVLAGLNEAATIVVRNTSQSTTSVNTTVNYNASVVAGTSTTQALVLENVFDPSKTAGTASKSAVTVNGVEIFNVTGSGSATSNLTALVSDTLTTVNIDGGQGVKIDALTFAGTTGTVDGSKNTGGINVTLTNSGARDVTVTGGTGNDRADFSNGFAAKDSFTGGAGTDTLVLSNAVATGAVGGTLSGVEVLEVSAGGNGTIDLSKFAGVSEVVFTSAHDVAGGNSLAGATSVTKAGATSTVSLDAGNLAQNLTVSVATDGAADATTINLNKVGTADAMGTLTVTDIETLTVNVADDAAVLGTGVLTVAGISGNKLATVNVTSNADVTITGAVGGAALKSFDLSAATGKATLTGGITTALTGATIKLGAGDDKVTVNATTGTATGGDTITLGAGKDVVTYTALAQSGDKTTDTITDFKSGEDKLDLTAAGILLNTSEKFLGVRDSFGLAQGALTKVAGQAVFQADTSTLWVDNGDGQLDASDFRIILTGNKTITAADLSLGTGASVTLSAAAATVNATTKTNANNSTTNENDTISATNLTIANSTINGELGTDSLTVSGNAQPINTLTAATATGAAITGVENITFSGVDGVMNIGANIATDVKSITLSSSNAGLTATTTAAGQTFTVSNTSGANASTITVNQNTATVTLGAAGDSVTVGTANLATAKINAGTGTDTLIINDAGNATLTSDIVGFENVTLNGAGTLTVTPAAALAVTQNAAAVTTIVGTGNTITVTGANNQNVVVSGSSNYVIAGNGTGNITSTATGTVATTAVGAHTLTSASATTVTATGLGGALNLAGAGAFTVNGIGTAAGASITEDAGRTGALTVNVASNQNVTVTENAGATGTVTVNHAGTGVLTLATVASHGVTTVAATAANTVNASGAGTISYTATGAGNHTITSTTTGAAGDVIVASTTSSSVDTITAGAGADKITISGGNDHIVLAPTTDTGIVSGFTASGAVPANLQQVNVANMDIITGFSAGADIQLTGLTTTAAAIVRNGGSMGAATVGDIALLTGDYNSSTGLFTVNTAGASTLLVYDDNGQTAGGNYRAVVLVGYVDAGGVDTLSGGGLFTGVA